MAMIVGIEPSQLRQKRRRMCVLNCQHGLARMCLAVEGVVIQRKATVDEKRTFIQEAFRCFV